jgi:diguanylate cyclase (GGDEF)-like protein
MNHTTRIDPQTLTWLELGEAQRLLIDQFPRLAFGFDLQGRLQWANPAGEAALGFERGELANRPLIGSLLRREEIEARAAELSQELGQRVPADESVFSARLRRGLADARAWVLRSKDGEPRTLNLSLGTLRDAQGQVTGLPTRAVLQDRAEMAIQRAARAGSQVGILLIELEGFDALCEAHGASVGDDLLRATAGRLHFELRKTDSAVRMPGGQFVAMLVDLHLGEEAERVAAKIAKALSGSVNTGVEVLHPRCRIGIAVYPTHGDQLLPLLEAANRALDAARSDGGATVVVASSG